MKTYIAVGGRWIPKEEYETAAERDKKRAALPPIGVIADLMRQGKQRHGLRPHKPRAVKEAAFIDIEARKNRLLE